MEDVDSAILKGKVLKSAFTGVTFDLWIECEGKTIMVQDYQNVEVGDIVGLKVDFYEIHLMKVKDEDQPTFIQEMRRKNRAMIEEQK